MCGGTLRRDFLFYEFPLSFPFSFFLFSFLREWDGEMGGILVHSHYYLFCFGVGMITKMSGVSREQF